ncbi:uncharacterized protein Z518_11262 [Rhinocladiella mackenziei CBS 650.93]|uniref:Heterokaryon incompatibility domain-containing protein n=1 Tax=Rhinocladiella mackenziei CBS 650.93 TaxID=1442369 RepID=A0A0D2I1E8_9EURO|nr:uncharacterized protein Z518_11262 [Rhinocladiella mackenziei CBS 650.93]KIW99523.1 hypothetical protein Z518_11262 [Rhinocladiella mackenziei CBS 650.93]
MSSTVVVPSAEAFRMLEREISKCVKPCNHEVLWPGFVPSRLLYVRGPANNGSVRLVTRGDVILESSWASPRQSVRYAALSYCWGPPADAKNQSKTERMSLNARLQAIPIQELSPVIQDAIMVAPRLSIPYLWVDALCIIQDDKVDWENEFSLMGLIFSSAYITISSLASSTCRSGFIQRSPHFSSANLSSEVDDWFSSSWSTWGWTFQEEKLSTRLAYFGHSKVHFCCSNWICTEDRPTSGVVYEKLIIDLGRDALLPSQAQILMDFWRHELLPQYSQRQFTEAKDKLPAVAGVAKYIGDATGYDYVAGYVEAWTLH